MRRVSKDGDLGNVTRYPAAGGVLIRNRVGISRGLATPWVLFARPIQNSVIRIAYGIAAGGPIQRYPSRRRVGAARLPFPHRPVKNVKGTRFLDDIWLSVHLPGRSVDLNVVGYSARKVCAVSDAIQHRWGLRRLAAGRQSKSESESQDGGERSFHHPPLCSAAVAALTASTGPVITPGLRTARNHRLALPSTGDDHASLGQALALPSRPRTWTTPRRTVFPSKLSLSGADCAGVAALPRNRSGAARSSPVLSSMPQA